MLGFATTMSILGIVICGVQMILNAMQGDLPFTIVFALLTAFNFYNLKNLLNQ